MICPVPNTHGRLNRSHQLWHYLTNSYQNPDNFVTFLNSTIQELRHLTFILQSEKRSVPGFDSWYANWQQKLKDDKKLKWLHDARNVIVKQKDLETYSVAEATIRTYNDYPLARIKSPVMISNRVIMENFLKEKLSKIKDSEQELVLNIERRWVVDEFPEEDISIILAYCFQFINKMVADLHKHLNISLEECDLINQETVFYSKEILPCMSVSGKMMNSTFKLSTKEELNPEVVDMEITPEIMKKAKQRYQGIKWQEKNLDLDIVKRAYQYIEMGEEILKRDGHHSTIAFLFDEAGQPLGIIPVQAADQSEKFILMRELAKQVERLGAKELIFVGESWVASEEYKDDGDIIRPRNAKDRKEALSIHAITAKGESIHLISLFERDSSGKISFEETQSIEHEPAIMNPILKIWNLPTHNTP